MNDPLATIRDIAALLVTDAQLCPPGELAIRLRERAASLRCAVAALTRALEQLAAAEQVPASA